MSFYENITVSAAVPNAAADAEAAKDAAVTAKNEAEAAKDAAVVAKNLAEQHKDTASGYVGTVSNAQSIADANVLTTSADKTAAEAARDLALQYRNTAQSASTTATNAVNQVSSNAATVAGMSSEIDAVYNVRTDITDVANNLTGANTIGTVASYVNQINTVSSNITAVTDVQNATTNISTVATDLTGSNNIGTVAGLETKINTVAGLSAELTSVHGNNADISTVATNLNAGNNIANVSSNIDNVNTVANAISDVLLVKNALSDIAAVENKLTEIDNVSDSITAVETVAGDVYKANVETVASISDDVTNLSKSTGNMATLVSKLGQTTDLAGAVTDAQNSATSAASSASTASTHATTASGHASTAATHAANLGSVAFQDLTAIAESKSGNALDVFVYDTSKDSDGGAWRNRTQGTSWYNEALNTSTRGATKKFPAVAVIVTDGDELIIYDGDDPSMPMWFTHGIGNGVRFATDGYGFDISTLTAKDGKIFVGLQQEASHELGVYGGIFIFDYVADTTEKYAGRGSGSNRGVRDGVRFTAWGGHMNIVENDNKLADGEVNDVAVKILPNAPIDPNNGLPVPTIAVATRLGVSVIKDDGGIVDITGQAQPTGQVAFTKDNKIACHYNYASELAVYDIAESDQSYTDELAVHYPNTNPTAPDYPRVFTGSFNDLRQAKEDFVIAAGAGLCNVSGLGNDKDNVMVNYINCDYNTGWLNGDIKLATLMDTTAETISAPELITNGDFSSFGSDIVSNGDFNNGTTDWQEYNTSIALTNVNGRLRVQEDGGTYTARGLQQLTTEVGKIYRVTYDVYPDTASGSTAKVYISTNASTSNGVASDNQLSTAHTGRTFYFKATTTTHRILLTVSPNNQNGAFADFDNVKVEEVSTWELHNSAANFEITSSGKAKVTPTAGIGFSCLTQPITTVIGKTYTATADIGGGTVAGRLLIGNNGNSGYVIGDAVNNQTVSETFVAQATTTYITAQALGGTNGQYFEVDNISLTEVVADRSVNNNGLNIVGNITKEAVATGAELMAYKVPTGGGYLKDDTFTPPTEDFCYMWWSKDYGSDRTQFYVGDLSANTPTPANGINVWSWSNKMKYRVCGSNFDIANAGVQNETWSQHCVISRDRHVEIWINGELKGRAEVHRNDVIATGIHLMEGYYTTNHSGGMALFRISATAPTPEQIAKIYRDEKPLFQEGAMCTLYGNSSHVTSMDYDDDTNTIHAGTSSQYGSGGLSEFIGLQRTGLNSNTTSVGYAVSAQNGLVVSE